MLFALGGDHLKKKKILFSAILSLLLVAVIGIGVTFALLRINTNTAKNDITFGDISVKLTEPEWDKLNDDAKIVYPGKSVTKDPIVTNTSSCNEFVYLEVKVPRATVRLVTNGAGTSSDSVSDFQTVDLFTYTLNSGWIELTDKTVSDDDYSTYIYAYTSPVAPNDSTPSLFDEITFANIVEADVEMNTIESISITAMAIQSDYLTSEGEIDAKAGYELYIEYKDK